MNYTSLKMIPEIIILNKTIKTGKEGEFKLKS